MSKSNSCETDLLELLFNATAWPDLAQDDGSSPATSLYVSLHTSDPGEAGTQSTNETAYTNYARVAVARTSGGWSVSGNTVSNVAAITFAQCGASGATLTHFGVGTLSSGAGQLLYSGALDAQLVVSSGITPEFAAGALDVTED